jgi:hypothetical protein
LQLIRYDLWPYLIEFLTRSVLFILALLLVLKRDKVSSPIERIKMRAAFGCCSPTCGQTIVAQQIVMLRIARRITLRER